ncbi:hypothetical protein DPMN_114920 [Dreissena polymorpha]|uniref:Uncharacterized protein n=1 Tax=Dreissena polymorpha TaxID=45954 RepID=A0A9D4QS05_DREPO|nr:hypothetical protein DPMN_114920 [Dreissena polymorpha]
MSLDKGSSRLSMRSTITAPQSHYYHAAGLTRILGQWTVIGAVSSQNWKLSAIFDSEDSSGGDCIDGFLNIDDIEIEDDNDNAQLPMENPDRNALRVRALLIKRFH